ncbi:MAG: glycosyltransferase family 2 protein [Phycisphaerae bacterium]
MVPVHAGADMNARATPTISFVIATHNRRTIVLRTLAHVASCGLDRRDYEVIVVDNASEDGTPDAAAVHADVIMRRDRNDGSCAKAHGVPLAKGTYIVFLDDDAYPRPGSIQRMIAHFERDASLAAAGFCIHLPGGHAECSAMPGVFVGCGVGFRADALRRVGGLDATFFMQAEEYDVAFRLVQSGWRVAVFDDLHVEHAKTPRARRGDRTAYYDIRNNLRIAARYLPAIAFKAYRTDWIQRYAWLAQHDGHDAAYAEGLTAGRARARLERWTYVRHRLSAVAFERFFCWDYIHDHMTRLAGAPNTAPRARHLEADDRAPRQNASSANAGPKPRQLDAGTPSHDPAIVLAGFGKNIYAFHRAARRAGVQLRAIADDRFAAPGRTYRGLPIMTTDAAVAIQPDAFVISDTSYVHARKTQTNLARCLDAAADTGNPTPPIHNWFLSPNAPYDAVSAQARWTNARPTADETAGVATARRPHDALRSDAWPATRTASPGLRDDATHGAAPVRPAAHDTVTHASEPADDASVHES